MEWWICGQINNDLFSTTYLKYFWYEFGKKIPEIDFVKRIVAIIMRTARRDHRIEIRIWRAVKSNTFEFPSQTVHNQSVRQCNAMQCRNGFTKFSFSFSFFSWNIYIQPAFTCLSLCSTYWIISDRTSL